VPELLKKYQKVIVAKIGLGQLNPIFTTKKIVLRKRGFPKDYSQSGLWLTASGARRLRGGRAAARHCNARAASSERIPLRITVFTEDATLDSSVFRGTNSN